MKKYLIAVAIVFAFSTPAFAKVSNDLVLVSQTPVLVDTATPIEEPVDPVTPVVTHKHSRTTGGSMSQDYVLQLQYISLLKQLIALLSK